MAVGNICVSFNQEQLDELKSYIKKEIEKEIKTIESRPKGHWIDNPPDSWICSNCGTHYEERLTFKAHNYCCVCGADMRGEE